MQAALTEPIFVYQGRTNVVMASFEPGTPEVDIWRMLVARGVKGILLRKCFTLSRPGLWVAQKSMFVAEGHYRFYAYGEMQS